MEEAPNPGSRLQASGSCVIYSAPSAGADAQAPLDTSGDVFVLVGDGPQKLARECIAIRRRGCQSGTGGAQRPAGAEPGRLEKVRSEAALRRSPAEGPGAEPELCKSQEVHCCFCFSRL